MIKSITVTNHLDESLKLVLGDSDNSGFLIMSVEGLGPCKATINSTEMATGDGSIFNSSRLEARNIVINMLYDYRYLFDMEELRHKSYRFFPVKQKIRLVIETDKRFCSIEGYVESNEPMIFSPREGASISILCPYPYFYEFGRNDTITTRFSTRESLFTFPFSNNSLIEKKIVFGKIVIRDRNEIYYPGDAPIGVRLSFTTMGRVGDITILSEDLVGKENKKDKIMTIRASVIEKIIGSNIQDGDRIVISTVHNNRWVWFYRGGSSWNILNACDRNSDWITLYPGINSLRYKVTSGEVELTVTNNILYDGV